MTPKALDKPRCHTTTERLHLFGGLLAGLTMLIVGLFVDLGDEWTMPLIVGWAGVAGVGLFLYLDWRNGNL